MTTKKKLTTIMKPKEVKPTKELFTESQMNRRAVALQAASQLVSNPVHAFAANPSNVMELTNVFFHFIEGRELPSQVVAPVTDTASGQTYA